jgi:hypothetical protein
LLEDLLEGGLRDGVVQVVCDVGGRVRSICFAEVGENEVGS